MCSGMHYHLFFKCLSKLYRNCFFLHRVCLCILVSVSQSIYADATTHPSCIAEPEDNDVQNTFVNFQIGHSRFPNTSTMRATLDSYHSLVAFIYLGSTTTAPKLEMAAKNRTDEANMGMFDTWRYTLPHSQPILFLLLVPPSLETLSSLRAPAAACKYCYEKL